MIDSPLARKYILTQTQTLPDIATPSSDTTRAAMRFARVMPLAFISYGLAYLDRVNYASAEKGLSGALHLSPRMGPFVMASFFLGYCLFQIPGAMYASKRTVKWLIFWALILWGGLSAATGVIDNVPLLIADRLLLGVVEGVVLPAMLIHLTRWFTRRERSRANALLLLTNPVVMFIAMALCGFLIDFFDHHRVGSYAGWQMMFILEGLPSIIWAFFWLKLADERPSEAKWLTAREAAAMQTQLDREQVGIKHVTHYWAAFSDIRVIFLSGMFLCFCSASYGLMMWLPGIVSEGTKQRPAISGLVSAIPYLIAIVTMLLVSWASDVTMQRKPYVFGSMLVGCAAFITSCIAGPDHFLIAFVGLTIAASCMYTPTGPLWAWMAEILPRNVAGEAMALVNSSGAFGGFIGITAVGWLKGQFHANGPAFVFQASCLACAALLAGMAALVPATNDPPGTRAFPVTFRRNKAGVFLTLAEQGA
jgi:sugar phosphate permease